MARTNRRDVLGRVRFRWCIASIGACGGRFSAGRMNSPAKTMNIVGNSLNRLNGITPVATSPKTRSNGQTHGRKNGQEDYHEH